MFFPFLPQLLALVGCALLMAVPPPAGQAEGPLWLLSAAYLALPWLGEVLGGLPLHTRISRWVPAVFASRRTTFLVVWLWALWLSGLPVQLPEQLQALAWGEEAALVLLMLNFWLGDALCQQPLLWPQQDGIRERGRQDFGAAGADPHDGAPAEGNRRWLALAQALRFALPMLALMALGLAVSGLERHGALRSWLGLPDGGLWGTLASLLGVGATALVTVPWLIRVCWGLHPLGTQSGAGVVRDELAANGVGAIRVLNWPDSLTGQATAGVIGVLPGLRYLLLSERLAERLAEPELRAVVAHEAGHIRHGHLWFYLAALVGFLMLMEVTGDALLWVSAAGGLLPPVWLLVVLQVGMLVLFFRFVLGYVSRHFERQADVNALRRTGAEPLGEALIKLARLNRIAISQSNWHHYGIAERLAFARQAAAEPGLVQRHHATVGRIKTALATLLVLGAGGQALLSSEAMQARLGESVLTQRFAEPTQLTAADAGGLSFLAARAYAREDLQSAAHYYRLLLGLRPTDTQVMNNLAWVLVTAPQAKPAELDAGLRLAQQATHTESQAYMWDTLAESHARLGEHSDAIEAARRALQLAQTDQGRGDVPLDYYRQRLERFIRLGGGA